MARGWPERFILNTFKESPKYHTRDKLLWKKQKKKKKKRPIRFKKFFQKSFDVDKAIKHILTENWKDLPVELRKSKLQVVNRSHSNLQKRFFG